ncbi:MAG: vitamin B12-dependent ribonucleotide reductase [Candidatus Omnitrophota bacterium]|nr:vitamin B12-dependent ribonucleotide reductase [Candidatus Omnitrophota bacterium]
MALSENARKVLEKRYLRKADVGKVVETPADMFGRVAKNIAGADLYYGKTKEEAAKTEKDFFDMMTNLEFLPNSPTLMNAGRELQQLSACFVLSIEDSMESIFETIKDTAIIHKCLTRDAMVTTKDGLKYLDEVKRGDEIMTDEGYSYVEGIYKNGQQIVYETLTDRGYALKGTAEHKVLTLNANGDLAWREMGELKKGDWIVMKPGDEISGGCNRLPAFRYKVRSDPALGQFKARAIRVPRSLTVTLAELIGIYIGDGSNHRDGIRFSVGKDDKEMVEIIERLSMVVFNKKATFSLTKGRGFEVGILSVVIKEWFGAMGFTKPSSRHARIPVAILKASEEIMCAFLRGVFSTDGCVRKNGHITLTTSSVILSEQLQSLLFFIGIPTHKRHYRLTDSYQISICTKEGFIKFKEKVGFLLTRQRARLESVSSEDIFTRAERVPNQRAPLKEWYKGLESFEERRDARSSFDDIINRPSEARDVTRQRIVSVLQKNKMCPVFLKTLLDKKYFFTTVSCVRPLGVMDTYDITVRGTHRYIANGFITHNSGGGTGFSFSRLRAKNSPVRSTGGISSGPVSFMKVFNAATQAVKQGGMRRGANMGILRVDHPDIMEFITCKENDKDITNFNISVAVTEDFIKRAINGEEYDLIDPHTKKGVQKLNAGEVLDLIIKMAWKNGEPGIVFIDRINKDNPTPSVGEIEATNPCGEQPLLPYESCNLGSVNLSKMVVAGEIDWKKLGETIEKAVHFLDNVIDMNSYPLKRIEEMTKANRKIGLGVMGFADMLFLLGVRYDSEDAIKLAEKAMKFVLETSVSASEKLAVERGAFPNFTKSVFALKAKQLRNATLTTIAPTGTLSIIADCSGGIEPVFAISYIRTIMDNTKLVEVHPYFKEVAQKRGFYSDELMNNIAEKGSVGSVGGIPEDVKELFVTAHDIGAVSHIRMQAAFQKYTNNAVSKTVNLPQDATIEDVREIYMLAYKSGCKGLTIYRDRSREEQVLNKASAAPEAEKKAHTAAKIIPRPRPNVTYGTTTKIATGCGNLYVTINEDEKGLPFEVFTSMGKAGGCAMSQLEAIGRLVSLAFRSGIDTNSIIEQLRGIRCPSPSWEKGGRIFSCSDAIARVIERRMQDAKAAEKKPKTASVAQASQPAPGQSEISDNDSSLPKSKAGNIVGVCPDCGNVLWHIEGCMVCKSCGYSKCG